MTDRERKELTRLKERIALVRKVNGKCKNDGMAYCATTVATEIALKALNV